MKEILKLIVILSVFSCDFKSNTSISKDYTVKENLIVENNLKDKFYDFLDKTEPWNSKNKSIVNSSIKSSYLNKEEIKELKESIHIPILKLDQELILSNKKIKKLKYYIKGKEDNFIIVPNCKHIESIMVWGNYNGKLLYNVNRSKPWFLSFGMRYNNFKKIAGKNKIFAIELNKMLSFAYWNNSELRIENIGSSKGYLNEKEIVSAIRKCSKNNIRIE